MKINGIVSPWLSKWRGQRGVLVFHLEAESIRGLPEDIKAGQGPLRVRVNSQTKVEGRIQPEASVAIEGDLALNEIMPNGRHLPPHIDADCVRAAPPEKNMEH